VTYCRTKCTPVLSASAAGVLKDHYVQIRQTLVGAGREDNDPDAPPPAIPITVRQLEAIVRMSEALAKMRLLDEVHDEQVREAIRIFQVSTLAASKSGECERHDATRHDSLARARRLHTNNRTRPSSAPLHAGLPMPVYPSIRLSIYLPGCLSVCLSVFLSVCLSVCPRYGAI
jgi:DNA replicative helicase MCM subunit Mcm2 (Cdc46/Mcm family)